MRDSNPRYQKKTSQEMFEYRSNILGVFHSLTSTFLAFYCIFLACGPGKNFFNDQECASTPRNITVFAAIFSASYFMADLVLLVIHTHLQTPLQKQYAIHHIVGWGLLTFPLLAHDYFTCVSVAFLSIEISGMFPNTRYLLFQHGFTNTSRVQTLNSMLLAFTFIFGRMPLFAVLLLLSAIPTLWGIVFGHQGYSFLYYCLVAFMIVMFLLVFVLNIYWCYAIVKMVIKVLKGGGQPP